MKGGAWLTHFLNGFHLGADPVLKPPFHHQSTQRKQKTNNLQLLIKTFFCEMYIYIRKSE